jgi:hypothetical protein
MDAAAQLRDYRRSPGPLKQGIRDISAARAEVGIHINKAAQTASTIFFYDNMENGANGWTSVALTGADLWHQTTLNASSPTHSWWPGIEGQANYGNGSRVNDQLISPPINLTSATAPLTLLFTENFVTERGWDYCMVDYSTDAGVTWNHLRGGYGEAPSGNSDGWQLTTLDLSAAAGSAVLLRFYFDTGDEKFNDFPGWFVDDVVIFDQGGTITGKKFFDVNNNHVKDPGERGIKNWLITASGPVTLTTKTNYRGKYSFTLPLGSYTVAEAFQPNWTQTFPLSGTYTINLATPDTVVDSVHFGNYINASFINGIKFHDLNNDNAYDGGDTLLPEWKILLCDTLGNQLDYDRTDSLGQYSLYVFQPGTYVVKEVEKQGWIETYPQQEEYRIVIPNLNTDTSGNDFGNFYSPLTNSILGMKFNDRNRSHSFDAGEEPVSGIKIQLYRKGNGNNYNLYKTRTTDSSGFYQFLSVPPDTYQVKEVPAEGWWQSYPDSFYSLILNSGQTLDSNDFGNYQIAPGTVTGLKYEDFNGNGSQDPGDNGLQGWHVSLSGTTYFNASVNLSTVTDGNGNYSFPGIWPGSYIVSEVWRSFWRQTEPASLAPHFLNVGVEQSPSGINFGNVVDSSFSTSFRTWLPESLGLGVDKKGKHNPIKPKPDKVQFWIEFRNDEAHAATGLTFKLSVPFLDTLTFDRAGSASFDPAKDNKVIYTFASPLAQGDSVMVTGFGKKPAYEAVPKWWWAFSDTTRSSAKTSAPVSSILRWPMPNTINFLQQATNGLRVGLGGPHSVVHPTYKQVQKSLVDRLDRLHTGDPRCLDVFEGATPKSIKKQQKYLNPSKHNNKLFAEAIALKANIMGSDLGSTPAGFGNLVFDDGTGASNPLNSLTIRDIAAELDSFMSSYKDTVGEMECKLPGGLAAFGPNNDATFDSLYLKIRMIDSAFSGPVDTTSFADGLVFSPVKPLSAVPFLRFNPTASPHVVYSYPPQGVGMKPEVFGLNQNYPNPFNPTTTISFTLSQESFVTLKVYNILGQEVATLLNYQQMDDGDQEVDFDANRLPSGVYFYRLIAESVPDPEAGSLTKKFTAVRKMLLVK